MVTAYMMENKKAVLSCRAAGAYITHRKCDSNAGFGKF